MELIAMLKIYRKEHDVDRLAPFKVFLNGMELCTMANGETKDYNLKAGTYKFKVTGGGFHSKELEVELFDDEIIQLVFYPAYKDNKMDKFMYKNVFGGEAIYLEVDKDFYL